MIDPSKQQLSEIEEKAIRLVTENRVTVSWVERRGRAAHGTVDGYHGVYSVSFSPAGRICTCPAGANHQNCSHGIALELVVAAGDYLQLALM